LKKKVREHHRKVRKEMKSDPSRRRHSKKDPGIPNLWPFKEDLLAKMEANRNAVKAEKLENKKAKSLLQMAQDAEKRDKKFESNENEPTEEKERYKDPSKRAYYKEFRKVIDASDVILEVLDARDPLGCRCPQIEQLILKKDVNKKIILVLNKIDLVPSDVVEKWLKYLRAEFPAIAFKCSTQNQRQNIAQNDISTFLASDDLLKSAECLGADTLLQLLKNYARNLNIKTSVTVGIIGYPNVGKSSLINSLKRAKVVGVGATPGFTKTAQEIHLDKNVKLLDCPGIVFSNTGTEADIILRNCVKVDQIEDPTVPVEVIIRRCRRDQLQELYCIPEFKDSGEFLSLVAQKKGKLKKVSTIKFNLYC